MNCASLRLLFPCLNPSHSPREVVEMQSNPFKEENSIGKDDVTEKKPLKGRFCADWRVIPALFVLVTCVLGIVLSLVFWKYKYVAIPFGVGAACAGYLLYLAYQYRHLQTLETLNETYQANNKELGDKIADLEQTNKELNETKANLDTKVQELGNKNEELSKIAQQYTEALELQNGLVKALGGVHQALSGDQSKISSSFEEYQNKIATNTDKANELVQGLAKTGEMLKSFFDAVNPTHLKTQIETQAVLSQQLLSTSMELSGKMEQSKALEEKLKERQKELEKTMAELKKLESIGAQLQTSANEFKEHTQEMKKSHRELKEQVGVLSNVNQRNSTYRPPDSDPDNAGRQ